MLIKASTQKNDDCFILFGGSGSEIVLCQNLQRNFLSCETHPKYYKMILDRLQNEGKIKKEYRLDFIRQKEKQSATATLFEKNKKRSYVYG